MVGRAQEIEVNTIQRKARRDGNFDPESFSINCFWGRPPDGIAVNEALLIVHILEFKRSTGTRGS